MAGNAAESQNTESQEHLVDSDRPSENTELEDFLLVEDGAELRKLIHKLKTELDDHTSLVCREIDGLWKLIKDFMRLAGPTLLCLVFLLLTRFIVSYKYQPMVLSSLLGCAVATIFVYSAPFVLSFARYRAIRRERINKMSSKRFSDRKTKSDRDTQTTDSEASSPTDTDEEIIKLGRRPSASTSESSAQSTNDKVPETIGSVGLKEPDELSLICQDCGDNALKTCDCCPPTK